MFFSLLLVGTVVAVKFGTKTEGINKIKADKVKAQASVIDTLTFLDNRECKLDYITEKPKFCVVRVNIKWVDTSIPDLVTLIDVPIDSNQKDIEDLIGLQAEELLNIRNSQEDYIYEDLNLEGKIKKY